MTDPISMPERAVKIRELMDRQSREWEEAIREPQRIGWEWALAARHAKEREELATTPVLEPKALLASTKPLKLDLGCGPSKAEGFVGVDERSFPGVDVVADLRKPWPWKDGEVDEVRASHFVEHLTGPERIHFANELHRVLKKGGKCQIITPHWASARAYGDVTHCWPPVCEWWYFYLNADWRKANAPHNDGYTCDFDYTWGYGIRPDLNLRNAEFQQYALANFKEAAQDLMATVTKR